MTYVIAEPCIDIKDLLLHRRVPRRLHPRRCERMLVIDPEECIDCGACEPECPVEAIFPEDALPEKWEPFVKINVRVQHRGLAEVDELVDAYATEHDQSRRFPARKGVGCNPPVGARAPGVPGGRGSRLRGHGAARRLARPADLSYWTGPTAATGRPTAVPAARSTSAGRARPPGPGITGRSSRRRGAGRPGTARRRSSSRRACGRRPRTRARRGGGSPSSSRSV